MSREECAIGFHELFKLLELCAVLTQSFVFFFPTLTCRTVVGGDIGGNTWEGLTLEALQVVISNQYWHSLSHCGHIKILPPMLGSHTSLLRDGGQENDVRFFFFF